uniref:Uncharacterized protein n=1 Tax=Clytia hemisphaerica TaxID=252671 RepID=A0A7M5VCW0_9CNID|eukprot:TCONS_00001287-protein
MNKLTIYRYNIKQHAEQVQALIEKYLVPMYYKRLGIKENERSKYIHVEDCLDPKSADNPKFEDVSYVAIDENDRIVGCNMNYFVTKQDFQQNFINFVEQGAQNRENPESLRRFAKHRYEVCHNLVNLFDDYNLEKLFYIESGIVVPEYRGVKLSLEMTSKACQRFGEEHGILWEGMLQNRLVESGEANSEFNVPGIDGFVSLKKILSYDEYLVNVAFRPPKKI